MQTKNQSDLIYESVMEWVQKEGMKNRAKCNRCNTIPIDFVINELNPVCDVCQMEKALQIDPNCMPLVTRLISREEALKIFQRFKNEE